MSFKIHKDNVLFYQLTVVAILIRSLGKGRFKMVSVAKLLSPKSCWNFSCVVVSSVKLCHMENRGSQLNSCCYAQLCSATKVEKEKERDTAPAF